MAGNDQFFKIRIVDLLVRLTLAFHQTDDGADPEECGLRHEDMHPVLVYPSHFTVAAVEHSGDGQGGVASQTAVGYYLHPFHLCTDVVEAVHVFC